MNAYAALLAFTAVCLAAATVKQVANHRRWQTRAWTWWPGATDDWGDELEVMRKAGIGSAAAR